MIDYERALLNVKVIRHWGPVCESGRHYPPHPGETCDEADAFIARRDALLQDVVRQLWEQWTEPGRQRARLDGTVFAPPAEPATSLPDKPDVDRALDILRPHLAWDHRYTA